MNAPATSVLPGPGPIPGGRPPAGGLPNEEVPPAGPRVEPTGRHRPAAEPVGRHRSTQRGRTALVVLGALALATATVLLRMHHQMTSYELGVDEIQYADIGNSFAAGRGQQLFGAPFFLHPPLFFALLGQVIDQPVPQMTVEFVLGLRWVELPFAALNCLLVIAIARKVADRPAALIAGAIYALDPFVIRFDSRLLLEAPMMSAVLLGILGVVAAVRSTGWVRWVWLVPAGLCFGVAVTTKSTSALITTLPLLVMLVTRWALRRREAAVVIQLQCAVYGLYLVWLGIRGYLDEWFDETLGGIRRILGVQTLTGFNAAGAPSFVDRVLANLTQFGPSYLLIGVAVGVIVLLLVDAVRARPRTRFVKGVDSTRLLTCWLAGVLVTIVYSFGFGEVEEQTFYLLAVPSAVAIAMILSRIAGMPGVRHVAMAATLGMLAGSALVWTHVHTRTDDAYLELSAFLKPQAGTGTVIALGDGIAQFVLPGIGIVPLLGPGTPPETVPPVKYALVCTELSRIGLAPVSDDVITGLEERYPLAFVATGRTVGELRLYDYSAPFAGPPASPGQDEPAAEPAPADPADPADETAEPDETPAEPDR